MNLLLIFLFLFYNYVFTSCSSSSTQTVNESEAKSDTVFVEKKKEYEKFETGKILNPVVCSSNPALSFALYLPSTYSPEKKYPSICFFDPHADGKLSVEKYKDLAEKYGFIIACSNNSHNGIIGTKMVEIYTSFFGDIQNRLSVDFKRLYVGGFSGGSRIASSVLLKENGYSGLISCGAGWMKVKDPLQNKFAFIGFAGNEDFNLTELRTLNSQLDSKTIPHTLVEFEGKHEWPPAEIMENAFIWFEFDAMKKKDIPKNDSLISDFIAESVKEIKGLESKKEWYKLYNTYTTLILFTEGLADNSSYKKASESLSEKEEMKNAMKVLQDLYIKEEQLKQEYSGYLQSKDKLWWKAETEKIKSTIKNDTDKNIRAMYKRLLSYLSLMVFSNASGALRFNELQGAAHFILLYKLIDPENPEHAYLSALFYARQNNTKEAITSLKDALKLGYKDYARMMAEKDFVSMQQNVEFIEIAEKIKPQ